MKIAVYYPWIYLTSGIERTILEYVRRTKNDCTIFTNHFDQKNTFPEFKNFNVIELGKVPVKRDIFSVLRAASVTAFQKIDLSGYDALFVHSDGLGDLITLRKIKIPVICFCHTPLRPVFDRYYRERALKERTLKLHIVFYFCSRIYKKIDQILWRRYSYIFFNSRETLRRAKKGGLLTGLRRKYEVLHPGVDLQKIKPSWIYKPYFLLPGRIMWTKNIEMGISAFIKFKKENPGLSKFKLVIAGQVDAKSKKYLRHLRNIVRRRRDIEFIISPTDATLKKIYSECWAVLMSSFNEDWGLTLIEGNAYGKPALAIDRGGPRESQIHGKTGYLVKPEIADFSNGLTLLAKNRELTVNMGKDARKHAENYDWSRFVAKIDYVLGNVGYNSS